MEVQMLTEMAYATGSSPQAGQGQGLMGFLPLIIIFVIFYFLLIRPQQKKAKDQKAMLDSLKKGDKVVVSGGEYGIVEEVKGNTVIVKIAENVKVKYGKAYIVALRQSDEE